MARVLWSVNIDATPSARNNRSHMPGRSSLSTNIPDKMFQESQISLQLVVFRTEAFTTSLQPIDHKLSQIVFIRMHPLIISWISESSHS